MPSCLYKIKFKFSCKIFLHVIYYNMYLCVQYIWKKQNNWSTKKPHLIYVYVWSELCTYFMTWPNVHKYHFPICHCSLSMFEIQLFSLFIRIVYWSYHVKAEDEHKFYKIYNLDIFKMLSPFEIDISGDKSFFFFV